MKVLLVDDEQLALDFLEALIIRVGGMDIVGKYLDSEVVLEALAKSKVDLVFLDMEMTGLHGLELASHISQQYPNIEIVFVTAHSHFALEAFEVDASDYLLKPVTIERLKKTLDKIKKRKIVYSQPELGESKKKSLYVEAFGSLSLFDYEGHNIKWRTQKVKELFAYLWHHYDKPIHKSVILEEIWGDVDPVKAATLLHTTVYQLRKVLRDIGIEDPVPMLNEQYTLNLPLQSDVQQFEQKLEQKAFTEKEIEEMVIIYKGDYFELEGYHWAYDRSQALNKMFIDVLEAYVNNEIKKGNQLKLRNYLEKLVRLNPYNEQYVKHLIEYYAAANYTHEMITLYEKIEQKWKDDLDVSLPAEITETYTYLLNK